MSRRARHRAVSDTGSSRSGCLQIISEASRFLPSSLTRKHPGVPWKNIKDTGNFLRHEYAHVSAVILEDVVKNHLKTLKHACEAIRDELDS